MWILEFRLCRFEPFGFFVFSAEIVVKLWEFDSIHIHCGFWNVSLIFEQNFWLGLGFGSNGSDSLRIHVALNSVVIFNEVWWSSSVTCVLVRRFGPFLWILGSEFPLVIRFHPFLSSLDPDPVRILLLFFSLFFSDPQPVITLVARCFRWRARVELQVQQFSDEDSRESLRIARICAISVWIWLLFDAVNRIQWWIWSFWYEADLNWGWMWPRVHECSWALVNSGEFDL